MGAQLGYYLPRRLNDKSLKFFINDSLNSALIQMTLQTSSLGGTNHGILHLLIFFGHLLRHTTSLLYAHSNEEWLLQQGLQDRDI